MLIHSDNEAVANVLNTGNAKDQQLMHLLRCVFFITAHFEINLRGAHVAGTENIAADVISRNNIPLFRSQVPQASSDPSPVPAALVDLVIRQQPDWTSTVWPQLFKSYLQPA